MATLLFRYRGPMNWLKIYKGSLQYFRDKEYDVSEPKYKDKTNEFEGTIAAEKYHDTYTQFKIKITYKAFDMNPTAKPDVYDGKLLLEISSNTDDNYTIKSPAGEKVLFKKDSWIHNMYRKLTERDRDENNEGELIIDAQNYIEWLKGQCNTEMKYG